MKKIRISIFIFIIALIAFVFSSINIIIWWQDNHDIESEVKLVQEVTPVKLITLTDEQANEEENYVSADLTEIKKINDEVVGWINIPETSINYPVVKHNDNSFYLTHSFDKSKNNAGWVFLDYRNNINTEHNTIIYGHNRLDGSMFGSLSNLTKKEYLNDSKEHLIYLSTQDTNYVYEIFSLYYIDTTDDYVRIDFNDDEYSNWIDMITNRSMYDFKNTPSSSDQILTLSTCYKHVKKLVVHAKLIRSQVK